MILLLVESFNHFEYFTTQRIVRWSIKCNVSFRVTKQKNSSANLFFCFRYAVQILINSTFERKTLARKNGAYLLSQYRRRIVKHFRTLVAMVVREYRLERPGLNHRNAFLHQTSVFTGGLSVLHSVWCAYSSHNYAISWLQTVGFVARVFRYAQRWRCCSISTTSKRQGEKNVLF